MSDRFEMFGEDGKWLVKDNEQMPHLLDLYKCHIRMNMFVDKIADLEAKLDEFNSKIVEEMELSAERRQIIEDLTIENKQLEQQLTEKEKQIE